MINFKIFKIYNGLRVFEYFCPRWDHVYTQPGMYEVSVVLHTVNLGDLEVTGLVIVQEELQDVVIDAPSFISIDR